MLYYINATFWGENRKIIVRKFGSIEIIITFAVY